MQREEKLREERVMSSPLSFSRQWEPVNLSVRIVVRAYRPRHLLL